jgi:hypothetical protein
VISELNIPAERPFPAGSLERRREHAVCEVVALAGRARRPRGRRAWLVPAGSLAAAGAAAAIVFLGFGSGSGEVASAATVLREAAAVARVQPPAVSLRRGQFLYVKSVNAYLATSKYSEDLVFTVLATHEREIWIGPDGGRVRETSGEPVFLSEADREKWISADRPELREPPWESPIEALPPLDLPTDPDAVYERLEQEARDVQDAKGHGVGLYDVMFTLVGDSLRETNATPAQRAALYEVAARIPGVELVGRVTDRVGRAGMAVAFSNAEVGVRHMLIFDPETAILLGEEQITLEPNELGYAEGTVIGYATYVETAVVDSNRERPRG